MAVQASGIFHSHSSDSYHIHEAYDHHEKTNDTKYENEYISHEYLSGAEHWINKFFALHILDLFLSPVMDYLTPPPDVTQ